MKLKCFLIVLCGFFLSNAAAQIDIPSHSPPGKIIQEVGYTTITIEYDRPSMRGAVIFGSTIPYNEFWDMSVNNPTTITFSKPVTIEGQALNAGTYVINAIPGKEKWTIVFDMSKYYTQVMSINPHNKEVLRVEVKPVFLEDHVETFTIDVGEITQSAASLTFIWENTIVKLKVGTEADMIAMEKIKAALNNPMEKMGSSYLAAAAYYLDNHKDFDQAMVWIDKAIEINGKIDTYLFLKARIYAEMGDFDKAVDKSEEASILAERENHLAFKNRINISMTKWKNLENH
jgi:hypothetical protein